MPRRCRAGQRGMRSMLERICHPFSRPSSNMCRCAMRTPKARCSCRSARSNSSYVGKIGIGRIHRGRVKPLQNVSIFFGDSGPLSARVNQVLKFEGLDRVQVDEAEAGDIVLINGIEEVSIGATLCDPESPEPLPLLKVDEPTL